MNAKNGSGKTTAFHVSKDRRAFIAAVEVRCVRAIAVRSGAIAAGSAARISHVVLQAAFAAKVRRPRGVFGAVGAGCSQHRCGVWRSLVGTAPAVLHVAWVVWDVGRAG